MEWLKLNGRRYKSLCGCDEKWGSVKRSKQHCYNDEKCLVCNYFPWVRSKKIADALITAGIKRKYLK